MIGSDSSPPTCSSQPRSDRAVLAFRWSTDARIFPSYRRPETGHNIPQFHKTRGERSGMNSNQPTGTERRRIFISYHHRGEQPLYDEFSALFHDRYEAITDNSIERRIDSAD